MPRAARLKDEDALIAVALKSLHPRKDPIVHCVRNILLAPKIFFRGLNRRMPEQKLYLFKIPAGLLKSFPTIIAISRAGTIDYSRSPTFPRTGLKESKQR
jgi:hypothetical protein